MNRESPHIRLGRYGERLAAAFLENKGYEILAADVHFTNAQVDLVARDGATYVLVEVKTLRWRPDREQNPSHNFSLDQQERIRRAAFEMMHRLHDPGFPVRCDLIEIFMGRYFPHRIRHRHNYADIFRSPFY